MYKWLPAELRGEEHTSRRFPAHNAGRRHHRRRGRGGGGRLRDANGDALLEQYLEVHGARWPTPWHPGGRYECSAERIRVGGGAAAGRRWSGCRATVERLVERPARYCPGKRSRSALPARCLLASNLASARGLLALTVLLGGRARRSAAWGVGEAVKRKAPEPGSTQRALLSRGAELAPAKGRQASWSQPRASLEVWGCGSNARRHHRRRGRGGGGRLRDANGDALLEQYLEVHGARWPTPWEPAGTPAAAAAPPPPHHRRSPEGVTK
ncbi:hypothetical protein PLESTM_001339300 [Pleodorina starrii]|nr:hypothetical protein PLESTM_001339300 [Pleodorina starrii]